MNLRIISFKQLKRALLYMIALKYKFYKQLKS